MTTVYIIRHGKYESPSGVIPFRLPGFHLAEEGKKAVAELAERLKDQAFVAIYTSPMERTQETAAILAKPHNIVPIIDERLLETRSPAQGMTIKEIEAIHPFDWSLHDSSWWKDNGGESSDEIFERAIALVNEKVIEHKDQVFGVVTHGDVAMILAAHFMGIPRITSEIVKIPYVPMGGGFRVQLGFDRPNVTPLSTG